VAAVLSRPEVGELPEVVAVMRAWQHDGVPVPLHPGDVGWHQRFGAEATAAALRTWRRDGRILAVGLLDGPGLVRLAVAPEARADEELVRLLVADLTDPSQGVRCRPVRPPWRRVSTACCGRRSSTPAGPTASPGRRCAAT
jgi:hypothetical protein